MELLTEKQQAQRNLHEYLSKYLNTDLDLWSLYTDVILDEDKADKNEVICIIKKYLETLTIEEKYYRSIL